MPEPTDYESGPGATERAAEQAWGRIGAARAVVLVEGESDHVAVDAAADLLRLDLAGSGTVVVPIGGAHATGKALARLAGERPGILIAVLCDRGEASHVGRAVDAVADTGVRSFVCDLDLEDELIRAVEPTGVERVLDAQGDLGSFRTLQHQPAWVDEPVAAQMRRFIGAGARRKLRYASALVRALEPNSLPTPLVDALEHVGATR